MITDTQKPHKAYPCLEAKAAETKHFLPCLEEVVKESLPGDDPIHHTMLDCLKAFNQISQHFDAIAGFPTPSEFAFAQNLAKRFFDQYDDLHAWASSKDRKLFHITHKFHKAHHLIRNAQHLNFRMHHNFRAEDFVGQVSVVHGAFCKFWKCSYKSLPKTHTKVFDTFRFAAYQAWLWNTGRG